MRLFTWLVVRSAHFDASTSCENVDYEAGTVTFKNGRAVSADLIVGADGIRVNIHPINFDSSLKRCPSPLSANRLALPQVCTREHRPATDVTFALRMSDISVS